VTSILDIILTSTGQGTYQAEGRDADGAVVARHVFRHRPDPLTSYQQLQALEQGALLSGDDAAQVPALLAEAEAFGRDLYGKLFGGELGQRWAALRAKAQAAGQLVRLRLRMAEDAPELDALPWEFLHDGQSFLAPDRQVLLARGVAALPDLAIPETETGPLAVLVVVSNPLDLPDHQAFEPDEELAVIYEALDEPLRCGQIQLEVVDEASLGQMQRALIARDYQVVHFIGHGNFDQQRGGYLTIETEEGNATSLDGAGFAHLLAGRGVRLVLLSSCLTARASPTQAYRSVAGALLRRGLPAVVAMQYPILITSARTFYRTVYQALAADRPLDVAVAEGQQSLYLERGQASLDWATPALFSRGAGDWRLGVDARAAALPAPKVELSSLGGLEVMERGFVGRQRQQRLIRRAFLRDEARAALIHGFGGIGKTVLATRLARRLAETERFEGVLGLRARPDLRADEILRAFNDFFTSHGIAAFDPVLRAPIPLAQKVDALAQILRQVRLIVLFDNCEDWLERGEGKHRVKDPDLAALLAGLLAALDRGSKLLLTSRYAFDALPPGRLGGALLAVNLGELGRGEAVRLMGTLPALRETDYPTRERVFQAVGGHPFVLNLLAGRAARDGVDHVLADVKTVRREAEEVGRLLLQQIVDGLSAAAKSLLERAGVLRRAAPRAALEALAGTHRIGQALDELLGWGLMAPARYHDELCAEPETRYAMHSLVREYAEGRLDIGDWRLALLALAGFYADEARLKTLRYGNVQVFNLLEARHYYFQAGEYQQAGELDQAVTEPLVRWGLLETARELNRQTAEHATGKVRAAALHHWGIVEQDQGNYAGALRLYEQSLQIKEELGDKAGVATSLHQLGNVQYLQGNYAGALRLYEQSLKAFEELGAKSEQAAVLHQLGMIQQDQGNYAGAVRLYEQSLKIAEELGDKAGVAGTMYQLGTIYLAGHEFKRAMRNFVIAARLAEELRHPNLGMALARTREIRDAVGEAEFAAWWEELTTQLGGGAGTLGPEEVTAAEAAPEIDPQEARLLAGLAQAAVVALQSEGAAARQELAGQLDTLAGQLPPGQEELGQLLAVLQGLLRSQDVTAQAGGLRGLYRRTYQAVQALATGEMGEESQPEGMTLDQVAEKTADDTIRVMAQGNPAQRGQLWEALGQLRSQAAGHEELRGLVAFLEAVCWLLEGGQAGEAELEAPFAEAWQRIQTGIKTEE